MITTLRTAGTGSPSDESIDRTIRRRRGLPGGRAVTGGLLIAVAAVGIFAAVAQSNQPPSTRYLVADGDLSLGQVIGAGDVRSVALDLPTALAGRAFQAGAAPIGKMVLAPVHDGELLQASVLASARVGVASLALSLERADGLSGSLTTGDRVDVYVSYGNGTDSSTRRVVAAAEVISAGGASSGGNIGDAGHVQVTLAVRNAEQRIDLINAAHAGTVTLARVTGLRDGPARPANPPGADELFVERERNNESSTPSEPAADSPTKAPGG